MRGLCPLLFLLFTVVILALCFAPAPSARSPSAPFRIIFVKTHKTASSTLAAIVRRVGKARGMRFLDPPDHINVDSFRGVLQTPYDIVCNHARDSPWLDTLVPNATRITIVREPLSRFLSAWRFFSYADHVGPLTDLLVRCEPSGCRNLRVHGKPVFNQMVFRTIALLCDAHQAWMLGVDSQKTLEALVSRIENRALPSAFQLVFLTDQFDHGLIFLQQLLHLDVQELAYLPLKSSEAYLTARALGNLTVDQATLLARLNDWDARIYAAARARFTADMSAVWTPCHEEALRQLRTLQAALMSRCQASPATAECLELRKSPRQLTAESAQAAREHRAAAPAWLTELVY